MGFFDRDVHNSFDRLFDFNRDDHLDPFEQTMQLEFLERQSGNASDDDDETDLDYDDFEDMEASEKWDAMADGDFDLDDLDSEF